jgi:molybdopterin synthase sulfur carrier subunit
MRVLYFAWVKARIGKGEETISPPADVTNVGALMRWLQGRGEGYADAFADANRIRAAVNQEHAQPDTPVKPGDEVAFFPPVTGG